MKFFCTSTFFLCIVLTFSSCKRELIVQEHLNASSENLLTFTSDANIIFIVADDIGYEIPSYTGGQSYQTPNIDFIANNGIQFCEARATPLCSPSRVQLFTGKYNFRNYVDWATLPISNYTIGNLMQSAGYSTCVSGKWQLGGGDASIRSFGFDSYMVWAAFKNKDTNELAGSHYRNPIIYSNAQITTYTNNEYGEDLHRNYLFDFIDSSVANNKKFFGLWTPNLGHSPFFPTPDDPEYTTTKTPDIRFFPSMVKYLDKEIGLLLAHLDSLGVGENTYIFFTTDNGTDQRITSTWRNQQVKGGKGKPMYSWGTHVPFIVYKKNSGVIKIDSSLIDFSDVMVTLSDMVGAPLPTSEVFDGVSFWPQMQGLNNSSARTWSFTEFRPLPVTNPSKWHRWVEDAKYRRYDSSTLLRKKNMMFSIYKDSSELSPIKSLNSSYLIAKDKEFLTILNSMKK